MSAHEELAKWIRAAPLPLLIIGLASWVYAIDKKVAQHTTQTAVAVEQTAAAAEKAKEAADTAKSMDEKLDRLLIAVTQVQTELQMHREGEEAAKKAEKKAAAPAKKEKP